MSPRPRGRPRRAATQHRILAAALALLQEEGAAGVTIEKVAARAGVGRPTVYRRWTSKTPLIADALRAAFEGLNPIPPDTGDVHVDVVLLLRNTIHVLTETPAGRILRTLLADAPHHPEVRDRVRAVQRERHALVAHVLARGIARRALPPTLPLDLTADLLLGPLYVRWLITGEPLTPATAQAIVNAVLP